MSGNFLQDRKAQLDKKEREDLEDVVEDLRERVETNVEFQLTQEGLDSKPDDVDELGEDIQQLVEAIELEGVDGHDWDEAFEQYVTSVGYTIVNRLAALRCMEVRDFIDEEVTVFKDTGLTPAAETLVHEEFLLEDEALLEAYHNTCDELAEEIEILFDRSTAYSLVDPDADTFEELCGMLDEVPNEVWQADDVLGWVYEYYNRPVVEALDAKNTLEPDDVGPANQFYTPHWVVRMLADNSLGKLYLEATGQESTVPDPDSLSIEERKERLVTPEDSPDIASLCTYLIPDEDDQDAPSFDDPSEIRVIDPACGSGHFLLYAFDILERIWWAERDDLDRSKIPAKILEHNIYGVDIDLRSCQLSAFNLYLKARTRTQEEDGDFEMPNVGIVCADARVAEVEEAVDVLDQITDEGTDVREALEEIINEFQTTEALGSLLDVQNALSSEFMEDQTDILEWDGDGPKTLNGFLRQLREAVDEQTSDSFGEQNLRSFLNLLVVLTQDYDVALMNPPYGARGRMPTPVTEYVKGHYNYGPEYYINFFEICDRVTKPGGRIGMIVQRSFMYKSSFQDFREDFIGGKGSFDFLAEYGNGVLDNAIVRTAGTVVRTDTTSEADAEGTFLRLHDVNPDEKEQTFLKTLFGDAISDSTRRLYRVALAEFSRIPTTPLSYWASAETRSIFDSSTLFENRTENKKKESLGVVRQGLATGNNSRFVSRFWEHTSDKWVPYTKGGEDAWVLPRVDRTLLWAENGEEVRRSSGGNGTPSEKFYFRRALTYTYLKSGGRRFGYLHDSSIFGHAGNVFIPQREDIWKILGYANSNLLTYLMLCQTPERHWEVGNVSNLPWPDSFKEDENIKEFTKSIAGDILQMRQHDIRSPHYRGPALVDGLSDGWIPPVYKNHPHRKISEEVVSSPVSEETSEDTTIPELAIRHARQTEALSQRIEQNYASIDELVLDKIGISESGRSEIFDEIQLRTNINPYEHKEYDPESITEPTERFPEMVKDLLLHLTLRVVHEDNDGIVPLSSVEDDINLLSRIEEQFERIFGDQASARLAEVDQVLGSQTPDEEAYPNLREWLEDELFDYHVSIFDRTPILWRFTTERLVSDPQGEGFACLIDYHQLDANVFDRLQNRYLEPRKALLRERRSAANRRRGDESLSTSEQAAAAEEYARCESGLEQIQVFEDKLSELAHPSPRDWSDENKQIAHEAATKVEEFRSETASRLKTLHNLADLEDVDMETLFSGTFYETVQQNEDEWLDALDELQTAFRAYAKDGSEPVEAHLYDLFEYHDDLVGSAHYASNGILFMTYYFNKFESPEQAKISDGGISERQQYLSELAGDLESYQNLAKEISDACDEIASDIESDWAHRALSEVTTAGYRPNRKHGVAINITPLADAEIVPKTVDDKVL